MLTDDDIHELQIQCSVTAHYMRSADALRDEIMRHYKRMLCIADECGYAREAAYEITMDMEKMWHDRHGI